jgi:hypothetical protein
MSLHFNQQVLYAYSRGTIDIPFLQNCIDKGYDINQTLFDGDGNFTRDIFYFVTKSYHESVEELISVINFLLDNNFNFSTKDCNYLYYFILSLSRLQIVSHPSTVSFICSFILNMQSRGLNLKYNSISYYYDPDLFEFILVNSIKKTSFIKLPISSIVFLLVSHLFKNTFTIEDSSIIENTVISKDRYNNELLKFEWITSLKKLIPFYDFSKKIYVLKRLE